LDWVSRQGAYVDGAHLVYLLKQQILMHSEHIDQTSGVAESSDDEDEEYETPRREPTRRETSLVADGPADPIISFQTDTSRSFPPDHSRKRRADDVYLGALSPTSNEEVGLLRYPHLWPIKHARRSYEEPTMDVTLLGDNSQ
jgi:hypothetical protein